MQNSQGLFLVLEGSDGSGKGTQFELLKKRLIDAGHEVEVYDFPRYDKPSSHFVKKYLNGEYGPASEISPYTASLFFALDRYEAASEIKKALAAGKIVLCNRYVGSNMAHQGSKFKDDIEKRSFFVWEDSLEFQLLNIPRPTINLFLRVPAEISYNLIANKAARSYTDKKRDEHEGNLEHLKKSVETYDLLCQLFPKDYLAIDCVEGSKLLDIEAISAKIWLALAAYLPTKAASDASQEVEAEDADFTKSVATDSGPDDGVGEQMEIKSLSLLAITKLLNLGVEMDIDFKSAWSGKSSSYEFYVPSPLTQDTEKKYIASYNSAAQAHKDIYTRLFEHYKKIGPVKSAHQSTRAITGQLVPVGAYYSTKVTLRPNQALDLLNNLRTSTNPELVSLSGSLRTMIKAKWPKTTQLSTDPAINDAKPKALTEILESLAAASTTLSSSNTEELTLQDYSPRNEFELLADGMYSLSDLTKEEILAALDGWDYQKKSQGLNNALKSNPQLLSLPIYRFDALSNRLDLFSLLKLKGAALQLQQSTVRYGYEVPEVLEGLMLDDKYMSVFDDFLELFSHLQTAAEVKLAEYATLSGHKLRWQSKLSASEIGNLSAAHPNNELVSFLLETITEVHPVVASNLTTPKTKPGPKKAS